MTINKTILSGNLTRDAEVRRTASGMAIVSFTVAVNDRTKNKQTGEYESYANFIDVTWFGTYAEKCAGGMGKGTQVVVCGKIYQSRWTNNDGQNRSKIEVIAEDVVLPPRSHQQETLYESDLPF